jgi:hypothetical protein
MKAFFVIILLASILSGFYELVAGIKVMAHNHYEYRHGLLDTSRQQPDRESESLGLTPKDLSSCNEYISRAYKESVDDGYRLGTGYDALSLQCFALAALLFLTSIVSIRAVGKGNRAVETPAPNKPAGL